VADCLEERLGSCVATAPAAAIGGHSCSPHTDPLMRPPAPELDGVGLGHTSDAHVGRLSVCGEARPRDHFPQAGNLDEAIADLELHRQESLNVGRLRWFLLLARGLAAP
jgi:hypothetical protein